MDPRGQIDSLHDAGIAHAALEKALVDSRVHLLAELE